MIKTVKMLVAASLMLISSHGFAGIINSYELDFGAFDGADSQMFSYDIQNQNQGSYQIFYNGATNQPFLAMQGNSWFGFSLADVFGVDYFDLDNLETSFTFDFEFWVANAENNGTSPEIAGLFFADFSNRQTRPDPNRSFNLYGSQDWGMDDYLWSGEGRWQQFSITLDDYLSGKVTDILFINDCDNTRQCDLTLQSRFRNFSVAEVNAPASLSVLASGLFAFGLMRRRSRG